MSKLESVLYLLAFIGLVGNLLFLIVMLGRAEIFASALSLLGAIGCAWGMIQLEK